VTNLRQDFWDKTHLVQEDQRIQMQIIKIEVDQFLILPTFYRLTFRFGRQQIVVFPNF
jgi:hypothetical protein